MTKAVSNWKNPEDEYFFKQEQERKLERQERLIRERQEFIKEQRRLAHWMCCPKCGDRLQSKLVEEFQFDHCKSCEEVCMQRSDFESLLSLAKNHTFMDHLRQQLEETFRPEEEWQVPCP